MSIEEFDGAYSLVLILHMIKTGIREGPLACCLITGLHWITAWTDI